MNVEQELLDRVRRRLHTLYGDRTATAMALVKPVLEKYAAVLTTADRRRWTQRDVVLITYGDMVRSPDADPLAALRYFLRQAGYEELINTVHLLPFCPWSSDDGFSVIDYREVDPALGDWSDIRELNTGFQLMFDLVLNHVSSQSRWFQSYLKGEEPFTRYFIEADPEADLSAVVRPRNLPLLTPYETSRGLRHVWTTFSADQVDLNYAEPEVLAQMLDVLLFYVRQGARIVRLDAIAYLWKEIGSPCIHLPQTHEVVRLMRDVLESLAPGVLLLTETNVPHQENVGYFGQGDEAHMVYQFSLPPLVLDALLQEDVRPLTDWMAQLRPAPPGCTFFNFTASHDGVGVRPLEGLVSNERFDSLVAAVRARGGMVSAKRNAAGDDSPYELNIAYFDALGEPEGLQPELHVRRFLTSQAIMLAQRGVPGVYFHSLVGGGNDHEGVKESGMPRRINRHKYELAELNGLLSSDERQALVFEEYRRLLAVRIDQPAFHPDAPQRAWRAAPPEILAFQRVSLDGRQYILHVSNVSGQRQTFDFSPHTRLPFARDLLSDATPIENGAVHLEPYQTAWLEARPDGE